MSAQDRECETIAYSFGPQDSPRACAELLVNRIECGRKLMFSDIYKAWGCRCCAPSTSQSVSAERNKYWSVWEVHVDVVQVADESNADAMAAEVKHARSDDVVGDGQ